MAIERGLKRIPIVYNSGGYESPKPEDARGLVDIYLPDMKYSDDGSAMRISKVEDYVAKNRACVIEMHRQAGRLIWMITASLSRGLLVSHLVLPNDLAGKQKHFRVRLRKDIERT